jgi:hypothetical protein
MKPCVDLQRVQRISDRSDYESQSRRRGERVMRQTLPLRIATVKTGNRSARK